MRVIFLNPQGNFDESDSFWCEHSDFGGQLVYVKEVCIAMARIGVKVDIITRLVKDTEWPLFSKEIDYYKGQMDNLRIIALTLPLPMDTLTRSPTIPWSGVMITAKQYR